MSVQFGRWNLEGQPPSPEYIDKVSAALAPYGPDSNESYSKGGIKILYGAFHTTKESRREKQPCISPSGAVITWDGRLDNRADLISELRESLTVNSTDVAIVAAAYEKWAENCLEKLIGDWALSIWNPRERFVLLAKDPIGAKHLYYSFEKDHVTWSTTLDPLVLFARRTFEICEEYIAGWFASTSPAAHLTPYVGIHAVPPSSSVLLRPGKHGIKRIVRKYWDFDPGRRICYRTDAEYEEHFRSVFSQAVQRRLRSDHPVLAELSGGMDSSSIVCMADLVIAHGQAECPRLDTISWYDSSIPNWDDPVYFAKAEGKRGRTGFHIDLHQLKKKEADSQNVFGSEFESDGFAATPMPLPSGARGEFVKQYATYMSRQGHLVTLSGIGGEEATGGDVPTPTPELQNLLARTRFLTFAGQLNAWATKMRKSRLSVLWDAIRGFCPPFSVPPVSKMMGPASWLHPGFVRRNRAPLSGYPYRVKLFNSLPSFQHNLRALDVDLRLVALFTLHREMLRDARYPYLDRDLLEFAFAIPREQIVGVGRRRFLMKRALSGIVPDELLNRKRKTLDPQEQRGKNETSAEWASWAEMPPTISSSIGIIDSDQFWKALQRGSCNQGAPIQSLKRTLTLESWLRHLARREILTSPMATERPPDLSFLDAKETDAPARPKSLAS
jgi:asparagine synthase (glutamine-hydrolysing)